MTRGSRKHVIFDCLLATATIEYRAINKGAHGQQGIWHVTCLFMACTSGRTQKIHSDAHHFFPHLF